MQIEMPNFDTEDQCLGRASPHIGSALCPRVPYGVNQAEGAKRHCQGSHGRAPDHKMSNRVERRLLVETSNEDSLTPARLGNVGANLATKEQATQTSNCDLRIHRRRGTMPGRVPIDWRPPTAALLMSVEWRSPVGVPLFGSCEPNPPHCFVPSYITVHVPRLNVNHLPDELLRMVFSFLDGVQLRWQHDNCLSHYIQAAAHFHPKSNINSLAGVKILASRHEDPMSIGILQRIPVATILPDMINRFRVQRVAPLSFVCRRFAKLAGRSVLEPPICVWVDALDNETTSRTERQRGPGSCEFFVRDTSGGRARVLVAVERKPKAPFMCWDHHTLQRWIKPPPHWSIGFRFGEAKNPGPIHRKNKGKERDSRSERSGNEPKKDASLRKFFEGAISPLQAGDHELIALLLKRCDRNQPSIREVLGPYRNGACHSPFPRRLRRWYIENYFSLDKSPDGPIMFAPTNLIRAMSIEHDTKHFEHRFAQDYRQQLKKGKLLTFVSDLQNKSVQVLADSYGCTTTERPTIRTPATLTDTKAISSAKERSNTPDQWDCLESEITQGILDFRRKFRSQTMSHQPEPETIEIAPGASSSGAQPQHPDDLFAPDVQNLQLGHLSWWAAQWGMPPTQGNLAPWDLAMGTTTDNQDSAAPAITTNHLSELRNDCAEATYTAVQLQSDNEDDELAHGVLLNTPMNRFVQNARFWAEQVGSGVAFFGTRVVNLWGRTTPVFDQVVLGIGGLCSCAASGLCNIANATYGALSNASSSVASFTTSLSRAPPFECDATYAAATAILTDHQPPQPEHSVNDIADLFPLHWTFLEDVSMQCSRFVKWAFKHDNDRISTCRKLFFSDTSESTLEELFIALDADTDVAEVFLVSQNADETFSATLLRNLDYRGVVEIDDKRLVVIRYNDGAYHAGILVPTHNSNPLMVNWDTYCDRGLWQRLVKCCTGRSKPRNCIKATPGRSLELPNAIGAHFHLSEGGCACMCGEARFYMTLVTGAQSRLWASTFGGQWIGLEDEQLYQQTSNVNTNNQVFQPAVGRNGLDFNQNFFLNPAVEALFAGVIIPHNMTTLAMDSMHSLINAKALEARVVITPVEQNSLRAYILGLSTHVNRCGKAMAAHMDKYDNMILDRATRASLIIPMTPGPTFRVTQSNVRGGGGVPPSHYDEAPHSLDPVRRNRPTCDQICGPELFPRKTDDVDVNLGLPRPTHMVLCGSCGKPVKIQALYRIGFCSVCEKKSICTKPRAGAVCGYPKAYGKCALCDSETTKAIVQSVDMGCPGPVFDQPIPIPTFTTPTITALKNINGNKDAVPYPQETTKMAIHRDGRLVTVKAPFKMCQTKSRQKKVRRNIHNGPTAIGVVFPGVPIAADDCRATREATINGRLLACAPEPKDNVWRELWYLMERHWDRLVPGKCPRGIENYRTQRAVAMMRGWADSFHGKAKRQKKHDGINKLLRQGVTSEDMVLTGMLKRELSQKHSETLVKQNAFPPLDPRDNDEHVTANSSVLCPRMLRYFGTQVVDALFGPDTCIAYKHLCKVWSGNHPIFLGAGRRNHEVGAFYDMHPQNSDRNYFTGDYSLMDLSSGAEAHAFYFNFVHKMGLYQDPAHKDTFSKIFPQKLTWQGVGKFELSKGMASGAVWTTLMNTVLNAVFSTFGTFRAWLQAQGFIGNRIYYALHDTALFDQFLKLTDYHGAFAGDDSVIAICGDHGYLDASIRQYTRSLGYILKFKNTRNSANADFLGCNPIRVVNISTNSVVHTMAPQPHRFFNTFGWARVRPKHPREHAAGVAYGWNTALAHVPVYGQLTRVQMSDVDLAVCKKEWDEFSESWRGYCSNLGRPTGALRANEDTYTDLARAWHVGVHVVQRLEQELATIASLPVYVGTPAAHAIMRGSAL